ncbi:MAG: hypothetical protein KKG04_05305 [Candidatus Thermoplasmatota archaeon]|nr:hypothetical protein [Candidatus Thermoplasmatota archaeon]
MNYFFHCPLLVLPAWSWMMQVQVMDLVLVSNSYGSPGAAGWIRADVDNNGEITVLDLVSVSNAYDAVYWTKK